MLMTHLSAESGLATQVDDCRAVDRLRQGRRALAWVFPKRVELFISVFFSESPPTLQRPRIPEAGVGWVLGVRHLSSRDEGNDRLTPNKVPGALSPYGVPAWIWCRALSSQAQENLLALCFKL